jgi:hypothetical protein
MKDIVTKIVYHPKILCVMFAVLQPCNIILLLQYQGILMFTFKVTSYGLFNITLSHKINKKWVHF